VNNNVNIQIINGENFKINVNGVEQTNIALREIFLEKVQKMSWLIKYRYIYIYIYMKKKVYFKWG